MDRRPQHAVTRRAVAVAVVLTHATSALAQVPPGSPSVPAAPAQYVPLPPPGYVPVLIESSVEAGFDISLEKRSDPIVRCPGDCLVLLPPREYWLAAQATDTTLEGKRAIKIEGPTRLTVQPRDRADRNTGLALGLGGIGLVVAGAFAMLAGATRNLDGQDDGDGLFVLGLAGFAGGAVMSPLGWVQFARRAPQINTDSLPTR